jgi:hypothetical protein
VKLNLYANGAVGILFAEIIWDRDIICTYYVQDVFAVNSVKQVANFQGGGRNPPHVR